MIRFSLLFLVLAATLPAQTSISGSLRGKIDDPQAMPVSAARIDLQSRTGLSELRTTSDASGVYEFARVPPGHYKLVFSKAGFRNSVVEDVEIAVNETTTADSNLALGTTADSIIVSETASIVQTDRSSIAGRVDERRARELP